MQGQLLADADRLHDVGELGRRGVWQRGVLLAFLLSDPDGLHDLRERRNRGVLFLQLLSDADGCTISGNGGGARVFRSASTLTNCTISGNEEGVWIGNWFSEDDDVDPVPPLEPAGANATFTNCMR